MRTLFALALLLRMPATAIEPAKSGFLFLSEPAYTQKKRELQLTLAGGVAQQRGVERERTADGEIEERRGRGGVFSQSLNLEYGITDAVELGLNAAGTRRRSENEAEQSRSSLSAGAAGADLRVRLLKEAPGRPEISAGAGVLFPLGDSDSGATGYEAEVAAARDFGRGAAHLSAGAGIAAGLRELSVAAAVMYRLPARYKGHFETRYEREEELELGERVARRRTTIIAGLSRSWTQGGEDGTSWELGAGAPLTLSVEKPAWGAQLQLKCEFDL